MVSCQKRSTRHAYAWQIGPFRQDIAWNNKLIVNFLMAWQYPYTSHTLEKSSVSNFNFTSFMGIMWQI